MTIIEELKYRGLLHTLTDDALAKKLEQETVTFYLGADPTADSLHIGHLVPYIVAKRLSERGHKPILLVGGGTGRIGDPSGKKEERQLLDDEIIEHNVAKLSAQVKHILPDAKIVNNYDWIKNISMIQFLRDVGKHFGLNYMLAKDSVKSRLESGISFTEFSYQIIQSLDFLELYQKENCEMQIGGQDQWGNITAGLELIRKVEGNDAKAYGLVIPLLTKPDGTKFGKTAGDAVWLDKNRTSPYEFYQYWINLGDAEAMERIKQFTSLSKEEIEEIEEKMQESPHLRHAQKAIAEELTTMIHGKQALIQVENITKALFKGDVSSLSKEEIEMGFKGIASIEVHETISLVDAMIDLSLASSKREARTLIKQNAIAINGEKIANQDTMITDDFKLHDTYTIIKRGKKHYGVVKNI